jgi:hypothetical protein
VKIENHIGERAQFKAEAAVLRSITLALKQGVQTEESEVQMRLLALEQRMQERDHEIALA